MAKHPSIKSYFAVLLFIFSLSNFLKAQLLLNEYSCSNISTLPDNFASFEDWVEIYNSGTATINLENYFLSNDVNDLEKWPFPFFELAPNSYIVVFCSGRDLLISNQLHSNFKLLQTSDESLIISGPSGIEDQQLILPMQEDHSRGRTISGGNDWGVFTDPSPFAFNFVPLEEYAALPEFSVPPGFHPGAISVVLSSPEPDTEIRFTLDGSEPTAASLLYSNPILISETSILRAKSFSSNLSVPPSFVQSNSYIINTIHSNYILSIGTNDFSSLENQAPGALSARNSAELFDAQGNLIFEWTGDMLISSNNLAQKSLEFKLKDQYGYAYTVPQPIFNYSQRADFPVLSLRNAENDQYPSAANGTSTHLRDGFVHSISKRFKLDIDASSYAPCALYLNGNYYGQFALREPFDSTYTRYYHNQNPDDIDQIEYNNGLQTISGDPSEWLALLDFIQNNDLSIASNYDYVEERLDISSFSDYYILNSWLVNSDWLENNTRVWRGTDMKWRYSIIAADEVLNANPNSIGLPNTTFNAPICSLSLASSNDPNFIQQAAILEHLLNNNGFFESYFDRFLNLNNGALSCDSVLSVLDSTLSKMGPDMPKHMAVWGGDLGNWLSNISALRAQIEGRCNYISDGLQDCYGVAEQVELQLDLFPASSGDIRLNNYLLPYYPFDTSFVSGSQHQLQATAIPGFEFVRWEISGSPPPPDITQSSISLLLNTNSRVLAHFQAIDCSATLLLNVHNGCGADQGSIQSELSSATPPIQYNWSSTTANSSSLANLFTGTYALTITDSRGCIASASTEISNPDLLTVTSTTFTAGCDLSDGSAFATVSGGTPDYSASWSHSSTQTGLQAVGLPAGIYSLTISDALGCTKTHDFQVPLAEGPENILIDELDGLISLSSIGGLGPYIYNWDGPQQYEGDELAPLPGQYQIEVIDAQNCRFEKKYVVKEPPLPCLFNMHTITPNGDGINDTFELPCLSPYTYHLQIFNRQGQLVFESEDYQNDWQGTYKGKTLADGSYFYVLKIQMPYPIDRVRKGALNIIR